MKTSGSQVEPPSSIASMLAPAEYQDWIESLRDELALAGPEHVRRLLAELQVESLRQGIPLPFGSVTPYVNSIPHDAQPSYPGDRELERRIKSLVRWNAMAMVVRANRREPGIGGHISTYASAATLFEVGFHHFFRGRDHASGGDFVYFQGHAAPGVYSRAFLEGRLSARQLENFRREMQPGGGLSSYPHPWLLPKLWEFPTVSMGLGPIMAIYRARFLHYLEDRGLRPARGADEDRARVWCFVGDGECDEPESLGSLTLAAREGLDNLIFVVNCNLQRLDGPVRGNGKIIQELEAAFAGAGWNVLKVLWASNWDPLFEADRDGALVRRLGALVDGESIQYRVESLKGGAFLRERFFGKDPRLAAMVANLTDDQVRKLGMGGHDPVKVHAAYRSAVEHRGSPTVILARTVKGYGLGEAGEGKNITHQQKKLNEKELLYFRDRFDIPIPDLEVGEAPFYRPPDDSPELRYLLERRKELGGFVPERRVFPVSLPAPKPDAFAEFLSGTEGREVSTTMAFVKLLANLLKDPDLGKWVVPIVPDEARTFGMESLFRSVGIYSRLGQVYEPVDAKNLLYYREAKNGQILEEGITEAGSMSSFVAAGTSYATHGVATLPFFVFYSMFGFQRIGDLIWAAADSRCRGFLMGATAGRTTLAGEGLQHQDGQSHVLALSVPNLAAYDPAFAYEVAVIVEDGIRRMVERGEDVLYYLTIGNENYAQPPMPEGVREGILRGMYRFRASGLGEAGGVAAPASSSAPTPPRAHLLGSGAILNECLKAQSLLEERFGVATDVWSVTSYKELRRDALECERWNLRHPTSPSRTAWIEQTLAGRKGVFVAASDYLKALPDSIARWLPGPLVSLGTDGFGRSESRRDLRRFFEVDAAHVAFSAVSALGRAGSVPKDAALRAAQDLGIDPSAPDPSSA